MTLYSKWMDIIMENERQSIKGMDCRMRNSRFDDLSIEKRRAAVNGCHRIHRQSSDWQEPVRSTRTVFGIASQWTSNRSEKKKGNDINRRWGRSAGVIESITANSLLLIWMAGRRFPLPAAHCATSFGATGGGMEVKTPSAACHYTAAGAYTHTHTHTHNSNEWRRQAEAEGWEVRRDLQPTRGKENVLTLKSFISFASSSSPHPHPRTAHHCSSEATTAAYSIAVALHHDQFSSLFSGGFFFKEK